MRRLMGALIVSVVIALVGCTGDEATDPAPASTGPTTTLPADIELIGDEVDAVVALFKSTRSTCGPARRTIKRCRANALPKRAMDSWSSCPDSRASTPTRIRGDRHRLHPAVSGHDDRRAGERGDNIQTGWDDYLASRGLG